MSQRNASVESNLDFSDRQPSWANPEIAGIEDDERSYSRRRSLECSSIEIQIVDTESTQDHTEYIIRVSCGLRSWIIKRRYKDFYYLDKKLKNLFPNLPLPALPPKTYLKSSTAPEIVDQRKDQLETYLNTLVKMPQVWVKNDFVLFLNDQSNLMTFIWNFERMRRLQDMLKSTTMENESNTAKLALDLEHARSQVKSLQDKLSHMEMIFLQQALGVAGEQLPNSVIRSISCSDNVGLSGQLIKELTEESAALYAEQASIANQSSVPPTSPLQFGEVENDEVDVDAATLMKAINLAQDPNLGSASELSKLVPQTPDEARTIAVSRELSEAIRLSEILSASPNIEKSKSEIDLSKLASPKISISAAESTLDQYNPQDLSQPWAAWVKTLVECCDSVILAVTPTNESVQNRFNVFLYVRELIAKTLGAQLFPIGSYVTRTYLPDGDVDATAFVPKLGDDSWFVKINEALCIAAFQGAKIPDVSVSNVSFVNTEIKMIRSMINGVSFDISTNQLPSLFADSLVERINDFVSNNHLFKRSLLLIKAWFNYESPRFTHGGGSLYNSRESKISSWVLTIMLVWTFNEKGKEIHFPLQALAHFLRVFSNFDWRNDALTIAGPVALDEMSADSTREYPASNFFPQSIFDLSIPDDPRFAKPISKVRERSDSEPVNAGTLSNDLAEDPSTLQSQSSSPIPPQLDVPSEPKKEFKRSLLNIVDPFDKTKNLFEGVEETGYEILLSALRDGYQNFQSLCEESSKLLSFGQFSTQKIVDDVEKLVKTFFLNTTQKFPPTDSVEDSPQEDNQFDAFKINSDDLQFSLSYGQLALGGKIDPKLLTQLILIILEKKGTMPVGEIGKNLQALLGCDALSKRLKDQFSGLKRAIENSDSPRIKMGSEHPFNPVVSLTGEKEVQDPNSVLPCSFAHAEYVFTPYQYHLQMQSTANKDAQSTQGRNSRYPYRRPPPVIESQSLSQSPGTESSPDYQNYPRRNNYSNYPNRGRGGYPSSPGGRQYYRNQPHMPGQPPQMFPMEFHMPIPPPQYPNNVFPTMPVFPPPPMQLPGGPIPFIPGGPYFPPQMHNSLSSSLSSSYGAQSPLSQSPMNPSYLIPPPNMPPPNDYQTSGSISPNTRKRTNS